MPLGGINVGWDETVPADSENAGLGAQRIRSLETALQQVLDSEHNFPATGGANTGYHRLGSARAFYDVESNVSSSGTDGRLYVTSDTSRLFHVGSAGTMYLGDANNISANTGPGAQTAFWAHDAGTALTAANAVAQVFFANAYAGVPVVQVSRVTTTVGSGGGPGQAIGMVAVDGITPSQMRITTFSSSGVSQGNIGVNWSSIGTRVL